MCGMIQLLALIGCLTIRIFYPEALIICFKGFLAVCSCKCCSWRFAACAFILACSLTGASIRRYCNWRGNMQTTCHLTGEGIMSIPRLHGNIKIKENRTCADSFLKLRRLYVMTIPTCLLCDEHLVMWEQKSI
ncbi:hypothetical protein GGS26DRAFT_544540, partial [Hypomontagnella submonticulosa]